MLDSGSYLNLVLSLLLKKVIVPTEFHEQAFLVDELLKCDTSGLVDSLSQFQVDTATVDIKIDTDSDTLNEILNDKWLANINSEFRGKGIEVGLKGLEKEYYKEVFRGASFPVLKILKWDKVDGINVPVSMVFVDGASVWAKDKDKEKKLDLFSYDYFIGKDESEKIEGEAYFMYKPFVRWFAKYPTPYIIRRGIYQNWKLISMIKNKEIELVDRIIPYIQLILKGTEGLVGKDVTYSPQDLEGVKTKIQELLNKLNQVELTEQGQLGNKSPLRVANFDEKWEQIIPDMEAMFKQELFSSAERNILAGFGFIDIVEAVSTSRRESVLNPKVFIKEINSGISDFKLVLKDLISLIKEKNEEHIKYTATKWIIDSKPVTEFNDDKFRTMIRSLSDRGQVSNETTSYICSDGQTNYEIERRNRTRETKQGDDYLMYPKVIQNQEGKGIDVQGEKPKSPEEVTQDEVPEDKKGIEKENFNQSTLDEMVLEFSKLEPNEISDELVFSKLEIITLEEAKKWKKNRTTTNYHRFGQSNPEKFQKGYFRTIWIDKGKGIKAIIGRLIGKTTTTVQSYLFNVNEWDRDEAEKWLELHKSELVGAPYASIKDLPSYVTKRYSIDEQRKWMAIWNSAYHFYLKKLGDENKAETIAFRTANSQMKRKGLLSSIRDIFKKK